MIILLTDWHRVEIANAFQRAVKNARITATTGTRIPDLIQIATALEIGTVEFLSFDHHQRLTASAEGLKVIP